jgi:hypothetical protein
MWELSLSFQKTTGVVTHLDFRASRLLCLARVDFMF